MTWLEALPPLVIITGAVGLMGILPAAVHRGFNGGRDKKVQRDHFTLMMERRDARIEAEEKEAVAAASPAE